MSDDAGSLSRPAFYAARPGGWRDWWTLLHPPYTAWHLSYVVIGASLAPHVSLSRLVGTLLAFLFAVGFAAHALDELHGRPLGTRIPAQALVAVTVAGLAATLALGIAGLSRVGWPLIPFMVLGPLLVAAYNWELFGGFVHTEVGFRWRGAPSRCWWPMWPDRSPRRQPRHRRRRGGGPVGSQHRLSTPAQLLRRPVNSVSGAMTMKDGTMVPLDGACC